MKKYTLFSFVFVLSLLLIGSNNVNIAKADDGCNGAGPYSTTTGQLCSTSTAPVACATGDLFSYVTGQPCSTTTSSTPTSTTTSTPTLQIGSRGAAVSAFQQMLANAGYSVGKIDGIYGKKTAAAATNYYRIHPCPMNSSGSSTCAPLPTPTPIVPISTTQTYSNSTYGVSFNYPSSWTSATDASATSAMGEYGFSIPSNATSLITLKVPTTAYPNTDFGGGYLNLSVSQQLNATQCLALNPQNSSTPGQGTVNINGVTFNWTSEGGAAAGTDTSNTSYSGYTNGTCYEFNYSDVYYSGGIGENGITGTSAPESDIKNVITSAMFTTPGSTTPTSSPTISGVSGPQTLAVGQQGTWTINASDPSNGNLNYWVNWGGGNSTCLNSDSCVLAKATGTSQQSATIAHTYSTAGTYTPTFTVIDSAGLTTQTSLSVVVGNGTMPTTAPVISSISPNSIIGYDPSGNTPDSTITITGSGFTTGNGAGNDIVFVRGSTVQTIPNQSKNYEANSLEGGAYGGAVFIHNVYSTNGTSLSTIINNESTSDTSNTGWVLTEGGGGGAGDGWRTVSTILSPGAYVIYVQDANGDVSNGLPFTATTPGTCTASGLDSTTGLPCGCSSSSGYSLITGVSCGGTTTTTNTVTAKLDSSSPQTTNYLAGQTGVVFAKIDVTNPFSSSTTLNNLQISSDSVPANQFIQNIKVLDSSNNIIGSISSPNFVLSGGNYVQSVPATLTIPANSSVTLTLSADVVPVIVNGNAQDSLSMHLGITSLTIAGANAFVNGLPVWGNTMNLVSADSDLSSVTVTSPTSGATWTEGTTQTINWQCNAGNTSSSTCGSSQLYSIAATTYGTNPSMSYNLTNNGVTGNSYSWTVGNVVNSRSLASGNYLITVCKVGVPVCSSSGPISINANNG